MSGIDLKNKNFVESLRIFEDDRKIDPDFIHPLLKVRVSELWQEMEPRLPEKMKVNKVDFDWEVPAPSWTKE